MSVLLSDNPPKIHYFGQVGSCLDTGFELAAQNRLDTWDSVQARMQTAGRGQMRRKWISQEGNLFVALRLPMENPFTTTAASVVIGALCANALAAFGCQIKLKWPNDLVVPQNGKVDKVGGILLEEKDGVLLAGIGINIFCAPDNDLVEAKAMPATSLAEANKSLNLPDADELWRVLVKHIYSIYKSGPTFGEIWKNMAEEMLVWRGSRVGLTDGTDTIAGRLVGLGGDGAALIDTGSGIVEKLSGDMRLL